jgi:hypothetical protein
MRKVFIMSDLIPMTKSLFRSKHNFLNIVLILFLLFFGSINVYTYVKAQANPEPGTTEYILMKDDGLPLSTDNESSPNYGEIKYFQSYVVDGGYIASGVGMRNRGYGTIELSGIPEDASTVAAYLYWDILSSDLDDSYQTGKINGVPISGELIGTDGDPCWGDIANSNYAYRADVTALIQGNGSYFLSDFASSYTDGRDPWKPQGVINIAPMIEGASLVVIYTSPESPLSKVLIYDGSILVIDNQAILTMDRFTVADSLKQATTTFIVADGQSYYPIEESTFNGVLLESVTWDGNDPQDGPRFSYGNLWDTTTVDVTDLLPPGSTSATATVGPGIGDCVVWVAQILSITDEEVSVPPTEVTITGDHQGYVGRQYEFMATVPSATTLPVTYVWTITGMEPITQEGLHSNKITVVMNEVGPKTISVEASNASRTITNSHSFLAEAYKIHLPFINNH